MPYTLHRLAAGSYDLILDGDIVGSVVRNLTEGGNVLGWSVELLSDSVAHRRPPPFTQAEHEFGSLIEATDWLGAAAIIGDMRND